MIVVATTSIALREGLRALLAAITPEQTIEFTGDVTAVLTTVTHSPVDLVVLDAELPTVSTGMVLGQIKRVSPETRLLALTNTVQQQDSIARFDVEAVLLKGIAAIDIADTIERLLAHQVNQGR